MKSQKEKKTTPEGIAFTETEKKLLHGLSVKIANKRKCSDTYVHHIINGRRATNTDLAQSILKDLRDLLELLRPEE